MNAAFRRAKERCIHAAEGEKAKVPDNPKATAWIFYGNPKR
jgi:hypothetical protein